MSNQKSYRNVWQFVILTSLFVILLTTIHFPNLLALQMKPGIFNQAEAQLITNVNEQQANSTYSARYDLNTDQQPEIVIDPNRFTEELNSGHNATRTLVITNTGGADLEFELIGVLGEGIEAVKPYQYDQSHYQGYPKGTQDTRVGQPVINGNSGPDGFGYKWIDSDEPDGPIYEWTDIADYANWLSISQDDDSYEKKNLSFPFSFYGKTYQSIFVNTNGYITFEDGIMTTSNYPIPCTFMPPTVAGFWTDLNPQYSEYLFQKFW